MSRYVFPSPRNNLPMSIDTPRTTIRKLTHTDYTMHGFRSTFRDWGEENFNHDTLLASILREPIFGRPRGGELTPGRD